MKSRPLFVASSVLLVVSSILGTAAIHRYRSVVDETVAEQAVLLKDYSAKFGPTTRFSMVLRERSLLRGTETKPALIDDPDRLDQQILRLQGELNRASWPDEVSMSSLRLQTQAGSDELRRKALDDAASAARRRDEVRQLLIELSMAYQQKIENIYRAREKTPQFGVAFWTAMIGILASISGMVLAWRKDRREILELRHKLDMVLAGKPAEESSAT
jgi:hypothetical protein